MEKQQYDPMTATEHLRYMRSTENNIKIFVSHRTDLNSTIIDNPIYVPIRCGAVFDPENTSGLLGDDTGDHISHKKKNLSEFTVQYWAWKNVDADYYGLCHYRRFLSFTEKEFPVNDFGMVTPIYLNPRQANKFGLLDAKRMEQIISEHDMVLAKSWSILRQPTPKGYKKTIREVWEAHDGVFITNEAIDKMFELIDTLSPEFSASARAYFNGRYHRGYNCYILKKELFDRLCSFQFPIIFEINEWLRTKTYCDTLPRLPGYIGEILYGIFTYHVMTQEDWNVKETQLVMFQNTEKVENSAHIVRIYIMYYFNKLVYTVINLFLPLGTKRREVIKVFWKRLKNKR